MGDAGIAVDHGAAPAVRVDRWLWSVRRFKTRSAAGTACTSGRVSVNGESAKPARKVRAGDEVVIRRRFHTETVAVVDAIDRRVSAAKAAGCFEDRTAPEEIEAARQAASFRRHQNPVQGYRPPGAGRPTKRDRRKIDRLRDGS